MCEKHKKVCKALNCFQHVLIFISIVSVCISISAYASLICVPTVIKSYVLGLKICAITAGIKKYKSIIKKKRKKHNKIALLAKSKLNSIKFSFLKL